jgi:hypothetical protein
MTYAKNSIGRSTGRRFNLSAIRREMEQKQIIAERKARARERQQAKALAYRLEHPVNIFG